MHGHICTQTFAYTNHTILAEALETWPISTMQTLLPRVYQIIEEIHRRFVGFAKEVSNHDQNLVRSYNDFKRWYCLYGKTCNCWKL